MQQAKSEEIVLGGGCFWCTEAIFQNLSGVIDVKPGYSGGNTTNPTYEDICTGKTGHAEVVSVIFDPSKIDATKILEVFFITHNPTTLNQQGADIGTQYRSVIYYTNQVQKQVSESIIESLNQENIFEKPIVTEVKELKKFYVAEDYHNNYYQRNKNQPYCKFVIQPKIEKLKKIIEDNKQNPI